MAYVHSLSFNRINISYQTINKIYTGDIMNTKPKRVAQRKRTTAPIKIAGNKVAGITHDISASGIYFEINSNFKIGEVIRMTVELDGIDPMLLECEGTVVRIDKQGANMGVAVKINPNQKTVTAVYSRRPTQRKSDVGHLVCKNPDSVLFGERVGKCEFNSQLACDAGAHPTGEDFGCKYGRLDFEQ